jgi:hypothetical protein
LLNLSSLHFRIANAQENFERFAKALDWFDSMVRFFNAYPFKIMELKEGISNDKTLEKTLLKVIDTKECLSLNFILNQ